ncbi:hypothetical protein O3P69_006511 [Scylla paramamosain]|uniref:Uncharacterized protein n=1 Tax=Scylla paramamosain TaxID=85552 RepID=A0AAW0U7L4_SCYPA
MPRPAVDLHGTDWGGSGLRTGLPRAGRVLGLVRRLGGHIKGRWCFSSGECFLCHAFIVTSLGASYSAQPNLPEPNRYSIVTVNRVNNVSVAAFIWRGIWRVSDNRSPAMPTHPGRDGVAATRDGVAGCYVSHPARLYCWAPCGAFRWQWWTFSILTYSWRHKVGKNDTFR